MRLARALKDCLRLPAGADLPARKLTLADVTLDAEEEAALFAQACEWARNKKHQGINLSVWQRDISTPVPVQPWPTAEDIWHGVVNWGLAEHPPTDHDPGFQVDEWLEPVLVTLCHYFARDERAFEACDPDPSAPSYSLSKGLMLFGPIGCGKTRLLELITRVDPRLSFQIHACPHIVSQYRIDGDKALLAYAAPATACFDDLGFETTRSQHFGNAANPMETILASRYRRIPRPLTHCTTNLDVAGLSSAYDARVVSRMAEMFNVVAFSHLAPDRRTA